MPFYGYARVSTIDQEAAGCDVIRAEKASGIRRDGRTELRVLLDLRRRGDTLVVIRIARCPAGPSANGQAGRTS